MHVAASNVDTDTIARQILPSPCRRLLPLVLTGEATAPGEERLDEESRRDHLRLRDELEGDKDDDDALEDLEGEGEVRGERGRAVLLKQLRIADVEDHEVQQLQQDGDDKEVGPREAPHTGQEPDTVHALLQTPPRALETLETAPAHRKPARRHVPRGPPREPQQVEVF